MTINSGTIARTICLFLALSNQLLLIFGKEVLPFAEEEVYQLVSLIFTIISSCAAWWKNNSFSKAAIEADKFLSELKNGVELK